MNDNYIWITYNSVDCKNGNTRIDFAVGSLSYDKYAEFWIPTRSVNSENYTKILKKRISQILNTRKEIHLAYYTGSIS